MTAWVVELLRDAPVERGADGAEEEEDDDDEAWTVKGVVKTCLLARTPACVPCCSPSSAETPTHAFLASARSALALVDALLASRTSSSDTGEAAAAAAEALSARIAPLVQLARASLADSGFVRPSLLSLLLLLVHR